MDEKWGIDSFPVEALRYLFLAHPDERIAIDRGWFVQGTSIKTGIQISSSGSAHPPFRVHGFSTSSATVDRAATFGLSWAQRIGNNHFSTAREFANVCDSSYYSSIHTNTNSTFFNLDTFTSTDWNTAVRGGMRPSTIVLCRFLHFAIKYCIQKCTLCDNRIPYVECVHKSHPLVLCESCKSRSWTCVACGEIRKRDGLYFKEEVYYSEHFVQCSPCIIAGRFRDHVPYTAGYMLSSSEPNLFFDSFAQLP